MVEVASTVKDDAGRNLAKHLFRAGEKIGIDKMAELSVNTLMPAALKHGVF